MKPEWALQIRDECKRQGVAFHFKQWGRFDAEGEPVGKKRSGRVLDGKTYDEEPDWYPGFVRQARLLAVAEQVRRARN